MSGAGNDFVVLGPEAWSAVEARAAVWIRGICRRGLSIGADGVLHVEPAGAGRARVRFFNPDGGAAFCGNGTRCAARYAQRRGWVGEHAILDTASGEVEAALVGDRVRLTLAAPEDHGPVELDLDGETLRGRFVTAGVPHFVVRVPEPSAAPLATWGPRARTHPRWGVDGANVDLVGPFDRRGTPLRTWERGVEGETLACGSGAVAAALALHLAGAPDELILVPASGRPLVVRLTGEHAELEGDARFVFEGDVDPEAILESER